METAQEYSSSYTLTGAKKEQACELATLIDMAGEGIPSYLWSAFPTENMSPLETGRDRARRESGGFSYKNALVVEEASGVAGMLLGYIIEKPNSERDIKEAPDYLRPLLELENRAVDSYYINAIAVFQEHRQKGYGMALLKKAEELARGQGARELSIIVSQKNERAQRLYRKAGFQKRSAVRVVDLPSRKLDGDWELMAKGILH